MPACIGLYGGTFDPIHLGHLQVAQAANRAFGFQSLHLLPCADPPLRLAPGASAAQRLAMVRLAVEAQRGLLVDDRELRRSGPSYTSIRSHSCARSSVQRSLWHGCSAVTHCCFSSAGTVGKRC